MNKARVFLIVLFVVSLISASDRDNIRFVMVENYEFECSYMGGEWTEPTLAKSARLKHGLTRCYDEETGKETGQSIIYGGSMLSIRNADELDGFWGSTEGVIVRYAGPADTHPEFIDPTEKVYEIYSPSGNFVAKTEFNSKDVELLFVFGNGQYIGADCKQGVLHIVNPISGVYKTHKFQDVEDPKGCIVSPGYQLYNDDTEEFYFSINWDRKYSSAMVDKNCNLLWQGDGINGNGMFSPSGEYIAFVIRVEPTESMYGKKIVIINRYGSLISEIKDTGFNGMLFVEEDGLLVAWDTQKTWFCDLQSGEVLREIEIGGQYASFCPNKQWLAFAQGVSGVTGVKVYDIRDESKDHFQPVWRGLFGGYYDEERGIPSNAKNISFSLDGKELTVVATRNIWIFKLEE